MTRPAVYSTCVKLPPDRPHNSTAVAPPVKIKPLQVCRKDTDDVTTNYKV